MEEHARHAHPGRLSFDEAPNGPRALLQHPSGAKCTVYLQGAHVTDWVTSGGRSPLYTSPTAVIAPGKPIRGGIPLCWPQFNDMGPLPPHGFIRVQTNFSIAAVTFTDEATAVKFRSVDDPSTQAIWPHSYVLVYTVELTSTGLTCRVEATNTGPAPWPFTCALHTYLAVQEIGRCGITGLAGLEFYDNLAARQKKQHPAALTTLRIDQEVDRIYLSCPKTLQLFDEAAGVATAVALDGFPDAVVWNPWAAKCTAIGDLPDDAYLRFVCIEAAAVVSTDPELRPTVQPGSTWMATLDLSCP